MFSGRAREMWKMTNMIPIVLLSDKNQSFRLIVSGCVVDRERAGEMEEELLLLT